MKSKAGGKSRRSPKTMYRKTFKKVCMPNIHAGHTKESRDRQTAKAGVKEWQQAKEAVAGDLRRSSARISCWLQI